MTPTPKPRRISREEAISELSEMRQAYSMIGQELVAQSASDAQREKQQREKEKADGS